MLTSLYWLGVDKTSGTWAWTDGETNSYTNWASGEPSVAGQCAQIQKSDGKWYAADCDRSSYLACELYLYPTEGER